MLKESAKSKRVLALPTNNTAVSGGWLLYKQIMDDCSRRKRKPTAKERGRIRHAFHGVELHAMPKTVAAFLDPRAHGLVESKR